MASFRGYAAGRRPELRSIILRNELFLTLARNEPYFTGPTGKTAIRSSVVTMPSVTLSEEQRAVKDHARVLTVAMPVIVTSVFEASGVKTSKEYVTTPSCDNRR